jgi:hypothetical protein
MRSTLHVLSLACVTGLLAGCSGSGYSAPAVNAAPAPLPFAFTAPVGAFYKDYTGPQRPAIDAVAADGAFVTATQTILLRAKMAGPVFDGGPNYYVWGFDRGGAAANAAPFPDEPAVKFNAVLLVTADPANGAALTASINLLAGAPAQPVTATLTAADTLQVSFAASLLPSTGFTPDKYTWNLWPRSGVGGTPAAQIASFIPEDTMAPLIAR